MVNPPFQSRPSYFPDHTNIVVRIFYKTTTHRDKNFHIMVAQYKDDFPIVTTSKSIHGLNEEKNDLLGSCKSTYTKRIMQTVCSVVVQYVSCKDGNCRSTNPSNAFSFFYCDWGTMSTIVIAFRWTLFEFV